VAHAQEEAEGEDSDQAYRRGGDEDGGYQVQERCPWRCEKLDARIYYSEAGDFKVLTAFLTEYNVDGSNTNSFVFAENPRFSCHS
jgi:hypothetical protein